MATPNPEGDVLDIIAGMAQKLRQLEAELSNRITMRPGDPVPIPKFTTANRPPAAAWTNHLIFNTTTGKHEGSNGSSWFALY